MLLGERIKQLRKEAGWSQGELAEKVGTDARQISRYENGRITPSLDVIVRVAEVLNVSVDHLVFEDVPRRPLHAPTTVSEIASSTSANSASKTAPISLSVIDAFVTKNRLRALAGGNS
jgi:transcriptional regulator with XRE-family HTH domain